MDLVERYLWYALVTSLEKNINTLTKEQMAELVRLSVANGVENCIESVDRVVEENLKQVKGKKHVIGS